MFDRTRGLAILGFRHGFAEYLLPVAITALALISQPAYAHDIEAKKLTTHLNALAKSVQDLKNTVLLIQNWTVYYHLQPEHRSKN